MRDLKPCPFCGGEAIYQKTSRFSDRNVIVGFDFVVGCKHCGMSLPKSFSVSFSMDEKGELIPNKDDRETARELWNRRADDGRKETAKVK